MRHIHPTRRLVAGALTLALAAAPTPSHAQKVVASHDEWLTQTGFFNANERQLVANALSWFGLGGSGNVLLYTGNSFLDNAGFRGYLTGLGYTVTASTSPASFAAYDAVFSEGLSTIDGAGLAAYAQAGGNVFYIGGTGIGGAAAEAAYSNTFLNLVGLSFAGSYNGLGAGNQNTAAFASQAPFGPALFAGVPTVYAWNGNDVSAPGAAGWTTQVFTDAQGNGTFGAAVYASSVPEPASLALIVTGAVLLLPLFHRRRAPDAAPATETTNAARPESPAAPHGRRVADQLSPSSRPPN